MIKINSIFKKLFPHRHNYTYKQEFVFRTCESIELSAFPCIAKINICKCGDWTCYLTPAGYQQVLYDGETKVFTYLADFTARLGLK